MAGKPMLVWKHQPPPRSLPVKPEIWQTHKEQLCEMFPRMTLEAIMTFMKVKHDFCASRHQYVLQFQKWDLHKYKPAHDHPATSTGSMTSTSKNMRPSAANAGIPRTLNYARPVPPPKPNHLGKRFKDQPTLSSAPAKRQKTDDFATEGTFVSQVQNVKTSPIRQHSQCSSVMSDLPPKLGAQIEGSWGVSKSQWDQRFERTNHIHCSALTGNLEPISDLTSVISPHPPIDATEAIPLLQEKARLYPESPPSSSPQSTANSATPLASNATKHRSPAYLLKYAQFGGCLDRFDLSDVREMKRVADLFFGTQLFEDAFVIYLMIYRILKSFDKTKVKERLSATINVAKSSRSTSHNAITCNIIKQVLQIPEMATGKYTLELFLLQSLLARIYQDQGETDAANYRRREALRCFEMYDSSSPSTPWTEETPFTLMSHSHLESLLSSKDQPSVARRLSMDFLLTRISVLRDLLDWYSWETVSAATSVNGEHGIYNWYKLAVKAFLKGSKAETLWLKVDTGKPDYSPFPARGTAFGAMVLPIHPIPLPDKCDQKPENGLGLSGAECFTISAFMIMDEDYHLPMKQRTRNSKGLRWAQQALSRLKKLSDVELAERFLSAYTVQNFGGAERAFPSTREYYEQRRDWLLQWSATEIELELPDLLISEDSVDSSAQEPYMPGERPFFDPPMNPSLASSSTDLASMKVLQQRTRDRLTYQPAPLATKSPSWSLNPSNKSGSFSFDSLMEVAQQSVESLSLAAVNARQAIQRVLVDDESLPLSAGSVRQAIGQLESRAGGFREDQMRSQSWISVSS